MICQVCKGLSSPQGFDHVTHLRAPLDSMTIDPITLSPMRPVKWKTYKYHTFALSIPLDIHDDDLDSLKLDLLS